jgi:hypothetical protein
MWLEAVVIALAVLQVVTLVALWQLGRQTKRMLAIKQGESGSVPELLLINALNKIDHRLGVLEARTQQTDAPRRSVEIRATQMTMPAAGHHVPHQNYELAQQLAREGSDMEQLITRCGLSRNEAELVLRLYAKRA